MAVPTIFLTVSLVPYWGYGQVAFSIHNLLNSNSLLVFASYCTLAAVQFKQTYNQQQEPLWKDIYYIVYIIIECNEYGQISAFKHYFPSNHLRENFDNTLGQYIILPNAMPRAYCSMLEGVTLPQNGWFLGRNFSMINQQTFCIEYWRIVPNY